MGKFKTKIIVPKEEADMINKLLSEGHGGRKEPVSYSADFEGGYRMVVELCGIPHEENMSDRPWTEAALFVRGMELVRSDPYDTFFGEWEQEYNGVTYVVDIVAEGSIHTIWHNDVCEVFEALSKEMEGESEDMIWDEAYEQISQSLEDEKMNLDIEADGEIIAIGELERWDGGHAAYKELGTRNIAEAMDVVMQSFGGENTFHIYERDGGVYVSQTGHDNPVNPSVFELRAYNKDFEWIEVDNNSQLIENSSPIGSLVAAVYGW